MSRARWRRRAGRREPTGRWRAAVALLATAGVALEWAGVAPFSLGHAVASGAVHGGLLALGWLLATDAAAGWTGPVVRLGATLLLASVTARLHPLGALAFLLVPGLLLLEALAAAAPAGHRARGRPAGPRGWRAWRSGHSSARTCSSPRRGPSAIGCTRAAWPPISRRSRTTSGANALSAEWLFRGAVFSLLWRRWSFWPAALVTTALSLLRYLLDPALPHAAEARAGAVFYLGLVGLIACALRAWSGSLLPGYLAALAFFAAYRMLAP